MPASTKFSRPRPTKSPDEVSRVGYHQQLFKIAAITIVYAIVAYLSKFILYASEPSPIWPPAGLALVAILKFKLAGLVGITLGDLVFNGLSGDVNPGALLLTAGVVLQAGVGAYWLWRHQRHRQSKSPGTALFLSDPRDVLGIFLLTTFGSTVINASLSELVMFFKGGLTSLKLMQDWLSFWMGDSMGILVVTPLLLTLGNMLPVLRQRRWEALLCLGVTIAVSLIVFMTHDVNISRFRLEYLTFALMVWSALRFGLPGAAASSFIIALIAILGTNAAAGPFGSSIVVPGDAAQAVLSLQSFLTFLTVTALTLATAEMQLRAVERQRANLSRYLAPSLVEQLAGQLTPFGRGKCECVTVLYADLTGFATLMETLAPEQILETLQKFLARMEARVFEHRGTLERYTGDGLVAVFGVPERGPQDASNALACARAMIRELAALNVERTLAGQPPLLMGVGIDSGKAVTGDVGSERCLTFMVVGKLTKVAVRLKDLCTRYQADIFISKAVQTAVQQEGKDILLEGFISIGKQNLVGMSQPISIFGLPSEHGGTLPTAFY